VIPKVCIQTAKESIPSYVTEQLRQYLTGWTYTFFTDADILAFFSANPSKAYPNITETFKKLTIGEHKADLFRYYYLFLKGGVYIDADLMLYEQIDVILGNKAFVSVRAIKPAGSIFNGFLAAVPNHPIIKEALDAMYTSDPATLSKNYNAMVSKLGTIVDAHLDSSVKLLKEITNTDYSCHIEDPDTGKVPMIHYQNVDIPNLPIHSPQT